MRPFIVGDTNWRLLENGVAMATASHERCYLVCGVTRLMEGSVGGGGGCPESVFLSFNECLTVVAAIVVAPPKHNVP